MQTLQQHVYHGLRFLGGLADNPLCRCSSQNHRRSRCRCYEVTCTKPLKIPEIDTVWLRCLSHTQGAPELLCTLPRNAGCWTGACTPETSEACGSRPISACATGRHEGRQGQQARSRNCHASRRLCPMSRAPQATFFTSHWHLQAQVQVVWLDLAMEWWTVAAG